MAHGVIYTEDSLIVMAYDVIYTVHVQTVHGVLYTEVSFSGRFNDLGFKFL